MANLQKSPSWDQKSKQRNTIAHTCSGIIFHEGFPNDTYNKTFTIITRDGEEHTGVMVDLSRQYAAEGKKWITRKNKVFNKYQVVCWIEESK